MKASKKFLSLLLVLAMVFSFAAVSASAEPGVVVFGGSPDGNQAGEVVADPQPEANQPEENQPEANQPEETNPEKAEPEVTDPEAVIVGKEKTYKYATLAEAIAAAATGATVQVCKDITFSAPLTITKSVKIELAEATLTFKNSGSLYDNALVIDNGASVTIRNGEIRFVKTVDKDGDSFGFVNGVVVEDGSVVLNNMKVNGNVVGGNKLSGDVIVKDGEFDFDPSAFVAEGYEAKEADGMFTVAEKAEEPEQPAEEPAEDEQPADDANAPKGPFRVVRPNQEGEKLEDNKTEDVNVTENMTIDLNGKTLTGKITVASGVMLKLINTAADAGTVKGSIELNGGGLIIENNVVITGDIVMKDDSGLLVSSSSVEVKGDVKLADGAKADTIDGIVTAGKFESLPAEFVPDTHEFKGGAVTEKAPKDNPAHTVKDASGNSYNTNTNYLQYFKGETELASEQAIVYIDKAVFVIDSEPQSVTVVGGKALTKDKDYTWDGKTLKFKFTEENVGADKVKITAPAFEALAAGANEIVFKFAAGEDVKVPLLVWPSVEIDSYKYVLGSKADITATVSDKPDKIKLDDAELKENDDWTFASGKLTVKAAALEKLQAGDKVLELVYNDTNNPDYPGRFQSYITVVPAPTIAPVDANKDNKWYNSGNALSYTVSPNVVSLTVDEKAVDAKNYSVSDKGVLSLKSDFLKTLAYGKHTLAVVTDDGNVSVEFTTGPSLVAKSGSNHTKGGQKDLVFTASDEMNAVYVGKTQLKSDYYTISADGKTITLKATFLNTLKADNTYTITAAKLNADGKTAQYSAATSFKILSAASAGATPQTGDTGIGLWVALLVISGAAIAVIIPKRREN